MVWMALASVAGAALSANSSRKATKQAGKAADQAHADRMAALDFSKEQYEDWKNIFGDFQENMRDYYTELAPEDRNLYAGRDVAAEIRGDTAQNLEAFQMEVDRSLEQVRETLDQRGIGTSGLATDAELEFAGFNATGRASIRREGLVRTRDEENRAREAGINAEREVAAEKFDFLRAGISANPASNSQQTYNSVANNSARDAYGAAQAAGTASAASSKATGKAIEGVATYMEGRSKNNAPIYESQPDYVRSGS